MTTINDLPIEILSHIFWLAMLDARKPCSHFLKKGYVDPWFSSDYKNTAPFVFLKVCGHWRAVAKATPLLWSTLNASNFRYYKGDCYPLPLDALAYWLSLSDAAPLDLYITTPNYEDEPELPAGHTEQILQLLAKDSRRWQSLSIFFDAHTCQALEDLLHQLVLDRALPALQCLQFDTTAASEVFDLGTLAGVIGGIDSLRELYLYSHSHNPPLQGIRWGRLTTIVLHVSMTVDEAAFYLAQSEAAETVTFDALYPLTDPDASYPQHTTLPCLRSLTLHGSNEPYKLLDVFDLPSLESLTITTTSHSPLPHALSLKELIARSQCPLQDLLIIFDIPLLPSDAAEYLLNPRLHNVPQVVLACARICGEVEEIVPASKKAIRPIWTWEDNVRGTRDVGWRQKFHEYYEKDARIINTTP